MRSMTADRTRRGTFSSCMQAIVLDAFNLSQFLL